jgi:hypothetical protein
MRFRRAVSELGRTRPIKMTDKQKELLLKKTRQRWKDAGLVSHEHSATKKERELIKEYFNSVKEGD